MYDTQSRHRKVTIARQRQLRVGKVVRKFAAAHSAVQIAVLVMRQCGYRQRNFNNGLLCGN